MAVSRANHHSSREYRTRVIAGPDPSNLALINLVYAPETADNNSTIIFKSKIRLQDTLIVETVSRSILWALRFVQIANPPPPIMNPEYSKVSFLDINCPVDLNWLFTHILPLLPKLEVLKIGTEVFRNLFLQQEVNENFACNYYPAVRQLHVRAIPTPNEDNYHNTNQLIQSVNQLLEYMAIYLTELKSIDMKLPIGTHLEQFLDKCPSLKYTGILNISYKHALATFSTSTSSNNQQQQKYNLLPVPTTFSYGNTNWHLNNNGPFPPLKQQLTEIKPVTASYNAVPPISKVAGHLTTAGSILKKDSLTVPMPMLMPPLSTQQFAAAEAPAKKRVRFEADFDYNNMETLFTGKKPRSDS